MICGHKDAHGQVCKIRIAHPMVRCRHHTKIDMEYVRATQKAKALLTLQQDETKFLKGVFAETAFEHGLQSSLTATALENWKTAKAAEGSPDYPAWVIEEAKKK
jgi:hypothetical protein